MQEKHLIGRIRKLRQIEPRKDWVSLTKKDILGQEPGFTFFPHFKPAFAGLIAAFMLVGFVGFAQNSLPGSIFYPIKKIAEKTQAVFVSEAEKPAFQLGLANKRLEDLAKAPAQSLAPAINEFQASISEAAKDLVKIDATTSNPVAMKKIVEQAKKLEKNKEKIEALGVVIESKETAELNSAFARIVESLIKDLEKRTLDEEKDGVLKEIKELFEQEKYSEALELYLTSQ